MVLPQRAPRTGDVLSSTPSGRNPPMTARRIALLAAAATTAGLATGLTAPAAARRRARARRPRRRQHAVPLGLRQGALGGSGAGPPGRLRRRLADRRLPVA